MAELIDGLKFEQRHGKERVRVGRVWRHSDGSHTFVEWNVSISLFSDCIASYVRDDNSDIVATDTMKNTVYVKAKECNQQLSPEDFAIVLAKHFTSFYKQVSAAIVKVVEKPWKRVYVNGEPHNHGFELGSEKHTAEVVLKKSGDLKIISGIQGLTVLKTTQSGFEGFIRDKNTILPETRERMLATEVTATWRYPFQSLASIPPKSGYFTEKYDSATTKLPGFQLLSLSVTKSENLLSFQRETTVKGEEAMDAISCTMTMKKKSWVVAMVAVVGLILGAIAELEKMEQPRKTDGDVSFLVIGDWGRKGNYNQTLVANQMGIVGEKLDVDFVVSVGDNFYDDGLTGIDDSAFDDSFRNIYTAPSLQKPWYTVLGNHDYRGDVVAQLSPVLKAIDERWICKRSFIVNADVVELFFVDTTPFSDKYFSAEETKDHSYDWRGVLPRHHYLSSLLKDVEVALRESRAKWKIVLGHHTIRSAGHHGDTKELVAQLLPILQDNKVDLYINGHDHCLEHISSPDSQLQFLTSGGGSKAWKGDIKPWNPREMKFYYDGQGFMSVQVSEIQVSVVFYDAFGNALHTWFTSKPLHDSE